MLFEDYNYSQYNKFVLVDPNGKPDSEEEGNTTALGKDTCCKHSEDK